MVNWIKNLKTSRKFYLLISMMAIFLTSVGVLGYYYVNKVNDGMTDMYVNRLMPVKQLNEGRTHARAAEAIIMEILVAPVDKAREQSLLSEMANRRKSLDRLFADYEKTKLDTYERERIPKYKTALTSYRQEAQKAIELSSQGKKQEGYTYFIQYAEPQLAIVNQVLTELAEYNSKVAEELNTQGDKDSAVINKVIPGVTLLALLAAVAVGMAIARTITSPLATMIQSIAKDQNGYITIKEVNIDSRDEVGELALTLNTLVDQVKKFVRQVADAAEQVAASSEELTASSEQSAQAANQVAASVTNVSQGADKQLQSLEGTAANVGQMSAAIQQMAINTTTMLSSSDKTKQTAQEGAMAINSAITQMANINQAVANSAGVVSELGEQSKAIGEIVSAISNVAGQTNLLALNAAIEAARAGEHGRGFAVVAEEVRKLAEQAQESAKQISGLLGAIQGNTEKAVIAMDEGIREVKRGTEVVNNAGKSFEDIALLVNNVTNQISEVSSAVQQMAASSQQVVTAVKDIERVSRDTAGQTQTVSAATEEQSASVEEIAASSQALAKMAQELQNAVAGFKI